MKPYPRYNQSSARWYSSFPETWSEVKAKRLFSNERERACSEDEQLAASQKYGVIPQTLMMAQNNAKVMLALKGTDNFKQVKEDDFVISLRSFEGGIEHSRYSGCISPAYTVLRLRYESSYPNYFRYALKCSPFIQALNSTSEGIRDGKTITYDEFGELFLTLPSQAEQKSIATFLDREIQRIDSLIEEKQNFIKLLKEKRQALISHVVTKGLNLNVEMQDSGIEWIGQVPKHWVVKKIKYDVLGIEQGWSPQCESTPVPDDQTWGVVKVGCVNRGIFNPEQNKKLPEELEPKKEHTIKKGDLLVSRANAKEWVGSAAVPDRDYNNLLLCDKIYRIRLDLEKADPEFFAYYLASGQAREQIEIDATGTSSSMLNIGQGTILNMPIPVPELPEQQSIVQGLKNKTSQIDRLVLEVLGSIELLKEHRTSLISAAVTGKIDVREAV
ncbi:restriction endonuclease subunit S [Pectobacterium brasiliense]|uniref:restriction endonuclease subunit S n=1 Tax=Pectobacterium brasiliense TaxID=180957 RepID=UPI001969909A|nr:restriction endonuclease subunit S [Pectobacterium brasiliense]QSD36721.1 restriction endonuclease subunit S [Pectobacterium brasiliense]